MPYRNPFKKIVTITKENHRYYGPTESKKMKQALTSISTDLRTVFHEIDSIADDIEALASGYLLPSGDLGSLYDLRRTLYRLEDRLNSRIYVQADQPSVL